MRRPYSLDPMILQAKGGVAPEADGRVEFILQLPTASPPGEVSGLGMDLGIFWEDGDQGSFDYSSGTDEGFDDFASFATDGIEQKFVLWDFFPSGSGGGTPPVLESLLFGASPDLVGNDLDSVRLIVHEISFESWVPDPAHPEIEGFLYSADLTYEFYGTPVPEADSAVLLAVAAGLFARRGDCAA